LIAATLNLYPVAELKLVAVYEVVASAARATYTIPAPDCPAP